MSASRRIVQLVAVAALAFASTGATALPVRQTSIEELLARIAPQPVGVYVTIEGSKQGKFKAENAREKHQGKIRGLTFHYDVRSPRDAASGMATGRRVHTPIVFTKYMDSSSPQIFQAMVTNEILTNVLFEFTKTDQNGEEYVSYTVKLTNATIAGVKQYGGGTAEAGLFEPADSRVYEDVHVAFQTIEVESKDGKTMASDSWGGARGRP